MPGVDLALDLERAVLPHVPERRQTLARGRLREARDRVLEDPAVVVVDGHLLARPVGRLEPAPDAERTVGIDPPRKLDPELVLLPDLARVRLARVGHRPAVALGGDARHGLAEPDPAAGVGLVAVQVVALAAESDRQDVVGVPGRLVPDRRQRRVPADEVLPGERLHPGHPVGVRPDRVVHAAEVDVERPTTLEQEVRQQEGHLEERERVLARPGELVPLLRMRRQVWRAGHPLVPGVG